MKRGIQKSPFRIVPSIMPPKGEKSAKLLIVSPLFAFHSAPTIKTAPRKDIVLIT